MAQSKFSSLLSRKILLGASVGAGLVFMTIGIIFWGGFNTAMEATNTMEFCISCHEMEENVYQEYKKTIHYTNRSGVRAVCSDCHVPDPWVHKIIRKIQASKEVWGKLTGSISTPEKFNAKRLELAKHEWTRMKESNSRECRNCHDFSTMNPATQKKRSRKQHQFAMEQGQTCIDCHKGIAHKAVHDQLSDEERDQFEKPNAAFKRELPPQWVAFLEQEKGGGSHDAAPVVADTSAPVEATPAAAPAAPVVAATPAASTSKGGSKGGDLSGQPDWNSVEPTEVTLFYPGQTSMEWILKGTDHSGARVFKKAGDRCFDCHGGEEADMGAKMVNGKKAETTPIPGKRPGIPLQVQASHDAEYLYMRFQWPAADHVPVPFADGGKMDPKNPIKLALMLANDDVEYAGQAGCWQTCHHDANTMPDAPGGKQVTKYLAESRTAIEIEGNGGKKRGGWDQLKDGGAIEGELKAGHFMDLLRFNAGDGSTENGHILADRQMKDPDGGATFSGELKDGNWTVVLKRKLQPGQAGDIDLDMSQVYNIGFAVHDDFAAARFHHVSLGFKLGFDNEEAEINAVGH